MTAPPVPEPPVADAGEPPPPLRPPPLRAHWGVLAAGLAGLVALQTLDRLVFRTTNASEWWFTVSSILYVVTVALIAAGVVGWLLAHYLRQLAAELSRVAVPRPQPEPAEPTPAPPSASPAPLSVPPSGPLRTPAPATRPLPPPRPATPPVAAGDDDHSLWRR